MDGSDEENDNDREPGELHGGEAIHPDFPDKVDPSHSVFPQVITALL